MANGVNIYTIEVEEADGKAVHLNVKLSVDVEDELEAIGWFVGALGNAT